MLYNELEARPSTVHTNGGRILIIDDSRLFVRVMRRIVEEQGGNVVGSAEGGAFGADMAVSLKPDVIILDHSMPDMNGVACLKLMRESGVASNVLVCSGQLTLETGQDYSRLGVDAIFVKPMNLTAFRKALRMCLESRGKLTI